MKTDDGSVCWIGIGSSRGISATGPLPGVTKIFLVAKNSPHHNTFGGSMIELLTDKGVPETTQAGIAALLHVDRTTVRDLERRGMPSGRNAGRRRLYAVPPCLHWFKGTQILREVGRREPVPPLAVVILGLAYSLDRESDFRKSAGDLAEAAGATPEQAAEAIGYLAGARLLPWRPDSRSHHQVQR